MTRGWEVGQQPSSNSKRRRLPSNTEGAGSSTHSTVREILIKSIEFLDYRFRARGCVPAAGADRKKRVSRSVQMTTGPARRASRAACKCTDREREKRMWAPERKRIAGGAGRLVDHGRVGAEPVGAARRCAPRDRNPRDRCPGLDRVRQPGAVPPRRRRCGNAHDECSHHVDLGLQRAAHDQFGTDDRVLDFRRRVGRLNVPAEPHSSAEEVLFVRGSVYMNDTTGIRNVPANKHWIVQTASHGRDVFVGGLLQLLTEMQSGRHPRDLASPPSTPNPHATTKRPNGRFRSPVINAPRQTPTSTSTSRTTSFASFKNGRSRTRGSCRQAVRLLGLRRSR